MAKDAVMDTMKEVMKANPHVKFGPNDYNHSVYGPILRKPGDHIATLPIEGASCAFVQNMPEGKERRNEFGTVWWSTGAPMDYHDHLWGYETFMVTSGKVDTYFNNKHCMMDEGDLFFIKPHVAHAFVNLETEKDKGITWLELYDDIRMYYGIEVEVKLERNYPDLHHDHEFQNRLMNTLGDLYRKELPKHELVDKSEVPWIRPPEFAIRKFENEAGTFMLKIARWEYDNIKEIWEFRPKKGLTIEFGSPFADYPLYYVIDGKMEVECEGETYVGEAEDFLHIPPWRQFKISFPEEGARILVCNETSELLSIMDTLQSKAKTEPDTLKDWDGGIVPILRKHNNWVTAVSGL
jgi:quercetin dioxygenase-like cupin family protein